MKKRILVLLSIMLVMCSFLCACGSSSYEDDLDSGWDKVISGDTGSMTDGERNAVEGFLEWESKQ